MANTSHMHTHARMYVHACARMCTHTHARTHTHTRDVQVIAVRWVRPTVTARSAGDNAGSWVIQINTRAGDPISPRFWVFFAYKKLLGRTETLTRDRMYCQTIRTVKDISRDDRARIATCSLRTPTTQTDLKLTFSKYPSINTNYIISTAPLYNIIIIFDTVLRQKRNFKNEK